MGRERFESKPGLIPLIEVRKRLGGISRESVDRLVRDGKLRGGKVARGLRARWMYNADDVDRIVEDPGLLTE